MIDKIYEVYSKSYSVSIDSRVVKSGDVFFALKGENTDGNKYAQNAIRNGAALAVIDNPDYISSGCVLVENALKTLQQLANYHRKTLKAKVLAITGSNGKTTTKELVCAVLSEGYRTIATSGNLNNHIGVPLTLLSLKPDVEIAIVEMGANGINDIAELCEIAQPDYGIITNIGRAHLGGFGGFEGVKKAKGELYRYLANRDGVVFFNEKNSNLLELAHRFRPTNLVPYSKYVTDVEVVKGNDSPFLTIKLLDGSTEETVCTNLVGNYNLENVVAAYVIGRYFNIKPRLIKKAIESYTPTNKRSQLIRTRKNTIILDAYNANPSSMRYALDNFRDIVAENKIAIIGEMLELGEYSMVEHAEIVRLVADLNLNSVFFVGREFSSIAIPSNAIHFEDVFRCVNYLKEHPIAGATILIKGSRGVKLEEVLKEL